MSTKGETETVIMSHVADIIRCDMFNNECPSFDGPFPSDCQQRSVPSSLITLVAMIIHGTSIKNEAKYQSKAALYLSLSQLILHDSVHHLKTKPTDTSHSRDREPPLPLFLGAYVHFKSQSKDIMITFTRWDYL